MKKFVSIFFKDKIDSTNVNMLTDFFKGLVGVNLSEDICGNVVSYVFDSDYQVDFKYECNDGTYDCIDFPKMLKPSSELNNTSVIWVNGNEEKISKLSNSISININDNYIFDSEFIE